MNVDAACVGCFYRFGHRLTGNRASLLLTTCHQTLEQLGEYLTTPRRKAFDMIIRYFRSQLVFGAIALANGRFRSESADYKRIRDMF